eukprot:2384594-Pleurochrysis_carterae.AAC.1
MGSREKGETKEKREKQGETAERRTGESELAVDTFFDAWAAGLTVELSFCPCRVLPETRSQNGTRGSDARV